MPLHTELGYVEERGYQQARNSVTRSENQFKQLKSIFGLNLSSAALPQ